MRNCGWQSPAAKAPKLDPNVANEGRNRQMSPGTHYTENSECQNTGHFRWAPWLGTWAISAPARIGAFAGRRHWATGASPVLLGKGRFARLAALDELSAFAFASTPTLSTELAAAERSGNPFAPSYSAETARCIEMIEAHIVTFVLTNTSIHVQIGERCAVHWGCLEDN